MANVIKHKRGSGSDPGASDLVVGELAIRTDTGKLFTKMDSGALAEIAGGGSDIAINTLSSSSGTGGGSATFNGSAYRFTLSSPPSVSAAQLLVSINGVIQKPVAGTGQPSEGFSVDGNDIILGDAPATGSDFFILTFRSLGVSVPADNSVTSAKIVDGTIVGTDLATNVDLVDNQKIRFGTGNDLQIYHDGTFNYIAAPNNHEVHINANSGGSTENMAKFKPNGAVELYHDNNKKFSTTTDGIQLFGNGYADFPDNGRIRMGASYDLAIYHDGTHSRLNSATGMFNIQSDDFRVTDAANSLTAFKIDPDGATDLRYNGSVKLQTTTAGIDVTGAITATGVGTFTTGALVPNGQYYRGVINSGSQEKIVGGYISGTDTLRLGESMYLTSTGLGIGTTSPAQKLQISGSGSQYIAVTSTDSSNTGVLFGDSDIDAGFIVYANSENYLGFGTNAGNERMRITSAGDIQIIFANNSTGLKQKIKFVTEANFFDEVGYIAMDRTAVSSAPSDMVFATGTAGSATEKLRIDSSGKILKGLTTGRAQFFHSVVNPIVQIEGNGDFDRQMSITSSSSTSNFGAVLILGRQRSGTIGGNSIVQAGDSVGLLTFQANDGSNFIEGARISANIESGVNPNDMPAYLSFFTNPGGVSLTERMRIKSDGDVEINTGNLKFGTAGKGISFSETSDASGKTSELFDDYEEGSWTPSSPGSHTTNGADYTKIGRVVYIYIYVSSLIIPDNTNDFQISGLPYTVQSANDHYPPLSIGYTGQGNLPAEVRFLFQSGGSYIYSHATAGNSSRINNSVMRSYLQNDALILSGFYFAA